jgi:hypothetical protein
VCRAESRTRQHGEAQHDETEYRCHGPLLRMDTGVPDSVPVGTEGLRYWLRNAGRGRRSRVIRETEDVFADPLRTAHHGLVAGRGWRHVQDAPQQAGRVAEEREKPTGRWVVIQQMVDEMGRRLDGEHKNPGRQQGRPDPRLGRGANA